MSDRLEEIKERSKQGYVIHTNIDGCAHAGGVRSELDVKWLISELEHCHVVVKRIKTEKAHLKELLSGSEAENKKFNSECKDRYKLKGYCNKHYQKWLKYGDPLHQNIKHGNV